MPTARLALLTTGGTIASAATDRTATTGYALAGGGPAALLAAVPELAGVATMLPESVADIASPNVTPAFMLALAQRVAALLARDDVDGAVITHGTDTLEETAWFLHLTVRSRKPVVVTGAMRPASALGADGPMNLLAAATVAACPDAAGRGVLVVLNDRIHSARLVRKAHTTAPDAFAGGELGVLAGGRPVFTGTVAGRHTTASQFDATAIAALPAVDILAAYAGAPDYLFDAAIAAGVAGLVVACTGNGSLSEQASASVERAIAAGITVVRSSRTLAGETCWDGLPGLPARGHTPQKARLLMALALTQGRTDTVAAALEEY